MFIQWEFLGLQIQETASRVALRELLWGGKGGARLHISSETKGSSLNIKRLLSIKGKPTCQCRRCRRFKFDPWVGKIPWRRKWQPALVFLLGKPHEQSSLAGYSPWDPKESDMTEHACMHASLNLFGTRNRFRRRQFFHLPGRGMVSGYFEYIAFFMHFISNLRLPLIWQEVTQRLGTSAL